MKSKMAARKKKEVKSSKKDTVADTIAFVIKGQLTPVKATLPEQRVTRQLAKPRPSQTKRKPEEKKKKKEDLNSSIQKIIKKYAKKFNIKRDGVRKTRRTAAMQEEPVRIKEEKEEDEVRVKQEPEEELEVKEEPAKPKKTRKKKLVQFWNGPKRHRVASLNALAKVHCLYENESNKLTLDSLSAVKSDTSDDEQPVKRALRNQPGLRGAGKHWVDTLSSDASDADVATPPKPKKPKKQKKEALMDLKDMVVQKRMASLNASAILAASYDRCDKASGSDYDSDSSAEEYFAAAPDVKKEEVIELHATTPNKMAVIVNQDTDVTITGVYVNSTTRSTRHEGYCSIAGMQYRISATSHTQTASTVATETLLSSSDNAPSDAQSCSSKSYTPLDALSNMQPPPGPGIHNTIPPHPGMPCQVASPPHRQHSATSAFSSPHGYPGQRVPPPPPPGGAESHPPPYGYYQPAGPLISVPLGHAQPPLPKSVPLSDASPTSLGSSTNQQQGPPPAPGSTNGDSSDNEVIITSVTQGTKELPPPPPPSHHPSYRYQQFGQYHAYQCPPPYHYQTPPPPPTPPYPHHDLCYPTGAAVPPPAGGFLRHPPKYAPYHRYPYYAGELYPPPSTQPNQQIAPVTGATTYGGGTAAPPAILEPYPAPPPAPPTLVDPYQPPAAHFYPSAAYGLPPPPTCYSHTPNRAIQYINATYQHCPCPLNTCPKNGHTGPLTGESKRSNISKDSKPLPPVALALPLEPVSATGPPSPARGSAGMPSGGMPPAPSPANYHQPPKQEKRAARVGKEMVRKHIRMSGGGNTATLLMCDPAQNRVKRELESPPERADKADADRSQIVESAVPPDCAAPPKPEEIDEPLGTPDVVVPAQVEEEETPPDHLAPPPPPPPPLIERIEEEEEEEEARVEAAPKEEEEETLQPCVATVAENVKVKNMKRKQSQTREEPAAPKPQQKKKHGSYKDFFRKHRKTCFGKPKSKLTEQQTNNRRMRRGKTKNKTKKRKEEKKKKLLGGAVEGGKPRGRRKLVKSELEVVEVVRGTRRSTSIPRWSNGWTWEGEPYEGKVFINSDETTVMRNCYPSMRHKEGDLIRPGDCVLLKAGPRRNDLPYVAKIASLWENPDDGEMMMSLLWYYRPEHTEQGRVLTDQPDEVFASRHKDSNSVACIDDKCYVLTFNEYCRYKKNHRRLDEGVAEHPPIVPLPEPYPRQGKQPPFTNISPEMVFFCRKVYDFRQKRLVKNPT